MACVFLLDATEHSINWRRQGEDSGGEGGVGECVSSLPRIYLYFSLLLYFGWGGEITSISPFAFV